jgi:hypothetical protein
MSRLEGETLIPLSLSKTTRSPMMIFPEVGVSKPAYHAQRRRLATAGRTEQSDEFAVFNNHA